MLTYLVVFWVIIFCLYSIYAQIKLSPLIDFIRQSPSMTKAIGDVSDLYYIFTMTRGNYSFARYLLRTRVPPPEIATQFADYSQLRTTSNIALFLHVAMGVIIGLSVIINLILKL